MEFTTPLIYLNIKGGTFKEKNWFKANVVDATGSVWSLTVSEQLANELQELEPNTKIKGTVVVTTSRFGTGIRLVDFE